MSEPSLVPVSPLLDDASNPLPSPANLRCAVSSLAEIRTSESETLCWFRGREEKLGVCGWEGDVDNDDGD